MIDIYGGVAPQSVPLYSVTQAARYVDVPRATVASWVRGRNYRVADGTRFFEPVIRPADPERYRLSFVNLTEIHMLRSLRKEQGIELEHVRETVRFMRTVFKVEHPLVSSRMRTDGQKLFIEHLGSLISMKSGQVQLELEQHVERVTWEHELATQLRPFIGGKDDAGVYMDARVKFGRLCLDGTGIPLEDIQERHNDGESAKEIALDYGQKVEVVERALAA